MASRSYRNNNPGNLIASTWVQSLEGYTGQDKGGFAAFEDWKYGLAALMRLLKGSKYRGLSIRDAIYKYAPPHENETAGYVTKLCTRTGLSPDDVVGKLDPMQFCHLTEAIVYLEGWYGDY